MELEGFNPAEASMVRETLRALESVGYDTRILAVVIKTELPAGRGGMTYMEDGMVLGVEAFSSQDMLNHVMEEELLHLLQKASGQASSFNRRTAQELEGDIDAKRRFHRPPGTG